MINSMNGHRKRLRDKFLKAGNLDAFGDYEIIELLLTLATPRKDCKLTAKKALKKFKNLQGVFEASSFELQSIEGIGKANVFGLKFIKSIAKRYLKEKALKQDVVNNPKLFLDFLNYHIKDKHKELFVCLFLNSANKAIAIETIFEGTLNKSSVYPREVIKKALEHKAAALIFAHNHPSGESKPSPSDLLITKKLLFACSFLDIKVHDHIIITKQAFFSFSENGYIKQFNKEFEEL